MNFEAEFMLELEICCFETANGNVFPTPKMASTSKSLRKSRKLKLDISDILDIYKKSKYRNKHNKYNK